MMIKEKIREKFKIDVANDIEIVPRSKMRTQKMRVAVYLQFGKHIGSLNSNELVKKYYTNILKRYYNGQLVGFYSDVGAFDADISERPGLTALLEDARLNRFDTIMVKNLRHLSHNLGDCINVVDELRRLPDPVGVFFEAEDIYTLNSSQDFAQSIIKSIADEESYQKSHFLIPLGTAKVEFVKKKDDN